MRWRKHTDVVEAAATTILDALREKIAEHQVTIQEVRRELKEEKRG